MPTCYFNPKNLSIYNELFEKRIQSGFIVKHPDLRLADIYVQSNEYEGVTGNESATLDSIESSGKNQFPGS
jgi:aminoglycoside phosphotransferase family enzyme